MNRTYTEAETAVIAQNILALISPSQTEATVLALQGDLGAGKTTLTKALAQELGIEETVVSPTFVIAKFYETSHDGFKHVVHIDAYRIESLDELKPLGWDQLLQQPETLVILEWPERIADAVPVDAHRFTITHADNQRTIIKVS